MRVRLEGVGLHGGRRSALVFTRTSSSTSLSHRGERASLSSLDVRGGDRATTARLPSGAEVRSIEHVFAAIGGLSAFFGLDVELEGDEAPLLDGASAEIARAIDSLEVTPSRHTIARVTSRARIEIEGSVFELSPYEGTEIEVEVDFPKERFGRALVGSSRWLGDAATFRDSIAPSRTFGGARELEALRARGLAAHIPEGAVVGLDVDDPARAPRDEGEPIRHKLLDLLGDLAPFGAPLVGRLRAIRPSHRATREAMIRAAKQGQIVTQAHP